MRTKSIVFSTLVVASVGACLPDEFEELDPCPAGQVRGEGDQCQPAGAGGAGGTGGQGGSGGPSGGGGGMAPAGAPVLQLPPRRVGLRRARAIDVTIGLQQPVGVDLSVTVDGLPAYMTAEPLTLPAGATSGVLVMRATNEAPLGVPSQVRVRAAGGTQPAEAVLEAWVQGEPGTLDETFGEGGLSVGTTFTEVQGLGASPDGELFVLGTDYDGEVETIVVAKYAQSGALETAFGKNGVLSYAPRGATSLVSDGVTARAIDVQPDGKLILTGIQQVLQGPVNGPLEIVGYRLLVSRHLPDGSLDVVFGDGGAVSLDDGKLSTSDGVTSPSEPPVFVRDPPFGIGAVKQAGAAGDILAVVPNAYDNQTHARAFRLSSGGKHDQAFGASGFAALAAPACHPVNAAPTPEGGLVFVGSRKGSSATQACVGKLRPDGKPDEAFGDGGSFTLPLPQSGGVTREEAVSVSLHADGKIAVAGTSYLLANRDQFFVARLLPDGSFDPSFAQGGRTRDLPQGVESDYSFYSLATAVDSRDNLLLLAQEFVEGNPSKTFVIRYAPDGALDADFGSSGGLRVNFKSATGPGSDFGSITRSMVQLADGRIAVVATFEGKQRIARLWP